MASNLKTIVSGSKLINKKVRKLRPRYSGVVLYPLTVETQYRQEIIEILRYAREQVNSILVPQLQSIIDIYQMSRTFKKDSAYDDLTELLNSIRTLVQRKNTKSQVDQLAQNAASATSIFNRRQVTEAYKRGVGVDPLLNEPWLGEELQSFAFLNSRLITTVPEKYLDDIQQQIFDGMGQGLRASEIASNLVDAYGVSERRAALIARDQIGKLNGNLNMLRNQSLGSTKYVWLTMGDDRVREEHQGYNGETFEWANPPADGNPGSAINCRCVASPVFDEE
jgi:SPP1 gp7 family putative phage head morphogenesis protein